MIILIVCDYFLYIFPFSDSMQAMLRLATEHQWMFVLLFFLKHEDLDGGFGNFSLHEKLA